MKIIEHFKRKEKPNNSLETLVGKFLLTIAKGTKFVVVASPQYGAEEYKCEVIVAASDLYIWAERHALAVWNVNTEDQAARKALPFWLSTCDASQDMVTYLDPAMHRIVEPYVYDFMKDGIAKVFCNQCGEQILHVREVVLDEKRLGDWSLWTSEWMCDKQHVLYHKHNEVHFHFHRK